jgi:hypothetical protein
MKGLRSYTSTNYEDDVADLKVVENSGATRTEPLHTRTRTVITMTSGILDPARIAEVDGVGLNLKTPQHDGVQWWCDL